MRAPVACLILFLSACLLPDTRVVADVVVLQGGGELRGEFLDEKFSSATADLQIRTVTGTIVTVPRSEVTSVTRRPIIHEQYEMRRRKAADTLKGQWELAEWCGTNNLRDRRQAHLRRILDFDPEHSEARRLLGYRLVEGRWMTQDEIMVERGFVKFMGQYQRPGKVELLEREQKESEVEKEWYPKVRQWSAWAFNGRVDRQNEGLTNLRAINDPNAVPALYRTLAGDKREGTRLLYVSLLSNINDERCLGPLVSQSLQDDSLEVRHAAVNAIGKIGPEKSLPVYLQALSNDLNFVVNRAGYALGELTRKEDLPKVVPQLLNALVTTHKYKVRAPDLDPTVRVGNNGRLKPNGADIARVLTSGQVPIIGTEITQIPTKVVMMHKEQQNLGVLNALKKLTGKNFPFYVATWREWWATQVSQYANQATEN